LKPAVPAFDEGEYRKRARELGFPDALIDRDVARYRKAAVGMTGGRLVPLKDLVEVTPGSVRP
jgi:hypothetical protein